MSDQQQRTAWALDLFVGFVKGWTAPAMQASILGWEGAATKVSDAIRAIAPKDDGIAHVGWAVFQREHDTEYDRERPSGYVHTMVSAVFENEAQAENAYQYHTAKDRGQYLVYEIRQIP